MLNKCTDKAWFVVELCESIKAFKVELANFELFSSSPKDIRISMSNVFPGRDKDWILYGQFVAKDDRDVQNFISNEGVFGKFVKVEVLSHYGNEHYCIVSLFKIFGISGQAHDMFSRIFWTRIYEFFFNHIFRNRLIYPLDKPNTKYEY